MILNQIIDPRDNLEKADRDELFWFAQSRGIKEIDQRMPAILMRKILRRLGAVDIQINRQLGLPRNAAVPSGKPAMMADDLVDDWKPPEPDPVPSAPWHDDLKDLPMGKLKAWAKQHGIKQLRTDTRETLWAKIVDGKPHAA